jgi:HEAT repeat protein
MAKQFVGRVPWEGPRRSVEALARRRSREAVVRSCLDLLAGREVDGEVVAALGGPPARWAEDGGVSGPDYWLRVWALRGLRWLWDDAASPSVRCALADPAWRVREMAAKVCARHRVADALEALLDLRDDRSARVRDAASRAVVRLTQ